jgi:hypothetical protein
MPVKQRELRVIEGLRHPSTGWGIGDDMEHCRLLHGVDLEAYLEYGLRIIYAQARDGMNQSHTGPRAEGEHPN